HSTDKIYGFGSGKRGQLGFTMDKFTRSYNLPQVVAGVEDIDIVTITTNGDHSAALTSKLIGPCVVLISVGLCTFVLVDGHLFTWGRGFLGNSDAYLPQFLSSPLKFMQIALGWNHILLLTDDGDVFMLGGNHHGMLSDPHKTSMEQKPPTHSNPCQSSDGKCYLPRLVCFSPHTYPGPSNNCYVILECHSESFAGVLIIHSIRMIT
ncbi:hypothetical protein GIB67_029219, partial [Kingdonia uniflora]